MIRDEHEKEINNKPLAFERVKLSGGKAHPVHKQQEEIADRIAREEWGKKTRVPSEIITVYPEPTELPDICKSEALLELEKKYYPLLKAQRIELDRAYNKVTQMQAAIEPTEFEIQDELSQRPFVYFDYNDNDGFGTFPEQIPDVINNLPEGSRVVKIVKASRGNGSFIYLTGKTQEEFNELAKQNILKARNKVIDTAKQELANHLKAMKQLISDYEAQKKQALQADIEQLTKISGKYAKAI
ncbi:TPA: transposase [Citrobacter freundii]|uniref:Transposase n=1 Tax=Citrobacter freundii TaxID=546 RepID=A0AAP9QB93_CITFR|nr:transposase [Citrobacter freundii]EKV4144359.1 transposase [Citrobacter freundii]ELO3996571.1 transposase [Citrobacter freundii]NTY49252.1 transposase [Citrobacter freundii]QLV30302.1 transposase [Citrobacter freundii]QLW83652.1 transposase [Citrobacter freundii]